MVMHAPAKMDSESSVGGRRKQVRSMAIHNASSICDTYWTRSSTELIPARYKRKQTHVLVMCESVVGFFRRSATGETALRKQDPAFSFPTLLHAAASSCWSCWKSPCGSKVLPLPRERPEPPTRAQTPHHGFVAHGRTASMPHGGCARQQILIVTWRYCGDFKVAVQHLEKQRRIMRKYEQLCDDDDSLESAG